MERKEMKGIGVFISIFVILGIGAILSINSFQESHNEYLCARLNLGFISGALEDILRMTEHQQLCHDENCTQFFDKKIEFKQKILNDTFEGKYCEMFGLSEDSE